MPKIIVGDPALASNVTTNMHMQCDLSTGKGPKFEPKKPGQRIAYCYHIHDGAGGQDFTDTGYRGAVSAADLYGHKHTIYFNFYANSYGQGSVVVGSIFAGNTVYGLAENKGNHIWAITDPVTVKFLNSMNNDPDYPPGAYSYNGPELHATMTFLDANVPINGMTACDSGDGHEIGDGLKSAVDFGISVNTYCNIQDAALAFPAQPSLRRPLTQSIDYHIDCSSGTDYEVTLDKGQNYTSGTRRMKLQKKAENYAADGYAAANAFVEYSLSPETWRGCGWGTGMGHSGFQTITGTVPAQPTPPDGYYRDSVVVSISYFNYNPEFGDINPWSTNCAH